MNFGARLPDMLMTGAIFPQDIAGNILFVNRFRRSSFFGTFDG